MHGVMILGDLLRGQMMRSAEFLHDRRKDLFITPAKEEYARSDQKERPHDAAAIIGERPIAGHDGDPKELGPPIGQL